MEDSFVAIALAVAPIIYFFILYRCFSCMILVTFWFYIVVKREMSPKRKFKEMTTQFDRKSDYALLIIDLLTGFRYL